MSQQKIEEWSFLLERLFCFSPRALIGIGCDVIAQCWVSRTALEDILSALFTRSWIPTLAAGSERSVELRGRRLNKGLTARTA